MTKKSQPVIVCRHCKKRIDHTVLRGLTVICPHCKKPLSDMAIAQKVNRLMRPKMKNGKNHSIKGAVVSHI